MKIEIPSVLINKDKQSVIAFLSNLENLQKLLPTDKIEDFKANADTCSFKLKGYSKLSFEKVKATYTKVMLKSGAESPFQFQLEINVNPETENTCTAESKLNADINPFVKMMVEKPLTQFFEYIQNRLQTHFA